MIGLHQIEIGDPAHVLVLVPGPIPVDAAPAPTVTVEDPTRSEDSPDREPGGAIVVTPDALDEALTGESGLGQVDSRRVAVDGSSVVAGRRYALVAEGGESELVEAAGATATWVDATAPLSTTYPAATSRLRGVELRATVPTEISEDEDLLEQEIGLLVRWVYYLQGRRVVVTEQARLVRTLGHHAYVGEAEALLRGEWPELVQQLQREPAALHRLVASCARRLSIQLRARNIDADGFLAGPQGLEVLITRCVWRFGELGYTPRSVVDPTTWISDARSSFLNLWHALVKGGAGRDVLELDVSTDQAPAGHSHRRRQTVVPK